MKKSTAIYYGILGLALCVQLLSTVFTLSQNIGYGQRISLLENKKSELTAEKNQLAKQLAAKTALQALSAEGNEQYINISEVLTVDRVSASLALN
jgi:hypothetical protein